MQNQNALSQSAPFSILRGHKMGWHFDPDPGSGGDPPTPPADEMIPKKEATAAFAARDKAKKQADALQSFLAELINLQPSEITVVDGQVQIADFEPTRKKIEAALKSGKSPDQLVADAEARFNRKLAEQNDQHRAQLSGRDALIAESIIQREITEACTGEQCVDGAATDIAKLTEGRIKVAFDPADGGKVKPMISVSDENGAPMLVNGQPATIKQLVADIVSKRPHFKKSRRLVGPGVGGNRTQPVTAPNQERRSVKQFMFGRG